VAGLGIGNSLVPNDPLNNKTKQAVAGAMNLMKNPFMKPAFHNFGAQP
jgi:hypothetical protein